MEARLDPDIALPAERTSIDYILTADYAEVINGKAYIIGAGWDNISPQQYPVPVRLGIAVGVRVPFLESNIPHTIRVVLRSDSAEHFRMEGQLETGRPPGARGESVLVPIAVNAQFVLTEPQTMELTAEIDDGPAKRLTITATAGGQQRR